MHKSATLFKQSLSPAFYLACSWTWCIGMFLPVLLKMDFGQGGWLIFMLCNVIGATAFAFIIGSAEKSRLFIQKHQRACQIFSLITIAFQLFFIGWVASYIAAYILLPLSLLLALYGWNRKNSTHIGNGGIVVWVLSIAVFIYYLQSTDTNPLLANLLDEFSGIRVEHIYALAILMFGFLLCPYLDLSFHHVMAQDKSANNSQSKLSYMLAFPLLFLCMLLFSLSYREEIGKLFLNTNAANLENLFYLKMVLCYLVMQSGFTVLVHYQRLQATTKVELKKSKLLVLTAFMFIAPLVGGFELPIAITVNEMIYRCFMSYYGIIAPAYVLLITFNRQDASGFSGRSGLAKWAVTTFALGCASVPLLMHSTAYNYLYLVAIASLLIVRFMPFSNNQSAPSKNINV